MKQQQLFNKRNFIKTFQDCLKIEKYGAKILDEYLYSIYPQAEPCTLIHEQKTYGDRKVPLKNTIIGIDYKIERFWTGNIVIEMWSNFPVKRGWIDTLDSTKCKYIWFFFIDVTRLVIVDFPEIQNCYNLGLFDHCRQVSPRFTIQYNNSIILLVPLSQIIKTCSSTQVILLHERHYQQN